jgi:hypothetical protein
VDTIPDFTPGSVPDVRVTFVELHSCVSLQYILNLQNGRPKNGLGSVGGSSPKRFVRVIFGFDNNQKVFIFFSRYSPSCIKNETFVNCMDVSDGETPIIFGLENIIPRPEMKRRGRIVLLNS